MPSDRAVAPAHRLRIEIADATVAMVPTLQNLRDAGINRRGFRRIRQEKGSRGHRRDRHVPPLMNRKSRLLKAAGSQGESVMAQQPHNAPAVLVTGGSTGIGAAV